SGRFTAFHAITFGALHRPDLGAVGLYDEQAAYEQWRRSRTLTNRDRSRMATEIAAMPDPPRVSLLLDVSGAPRAAIEMTTASVRRQLYPHWELCVFDGEGEKPDLRSVRGEYVGLVSPGDELAEHALYQMARAIVTDRKLDMVYSDEDQIDEA